MTRGWLTLLLVTCMALHVLGDCPHERTTLSKWSDNTIWPNNQPPSENDSIDISSAILMDINPPALYNITILAGGSLVFDPRVELDIRVANIYVYGSLEIGSEDCLYDGKLTITLTGNRESHDGEAHPKTIICFAGGKVAMHGAQKRSWTKLTETLKADVDNADILFDYSRTDDATYRAFIRGIVAYTFTVTNDVPVIKTFDVYGINNHGDALRAQIQDVADGEVLMMTSQRFIKVPSDTTKLTSICDALETLLYDKVTNTLKLRNINPDGDTWALVFEKGVSNSSTEVLNPLGVNAFARHTKGSLIYSAEVYGDSSDKNKQYQNFRIGTIDGIFPKIKLIDDVTTWIPGETLVVATTDYDYRQTEEFIVALCTDDDCADNEVRLDGSVKYTHWGEILRGAVDMRAEVMVLNRNVVIKGTYEDSCPSFNKKCSDAIVANRDLYGGHIKVLANYLKASFENIELHHMGQQTDLGRYPLHYHLCFAVNEAASMPYIKGCSIHHTFARCATVHGSHNVTVKDNACYEPMGHGYFSEDGGELDTVYDGNLVINTRKGPGFLEPTDKIKPAGFWMTNPNTYFSNNHAAGGEGFGIWFIFPNPELPPSRYWNVMGVDEEKRTPIPLFYNNVAHSQWQTGIMIGGVLRDDRSAHCCNKWQPLEDPKNASSSPIQIPLDRLTVWKCRDRNLWLEGGLLNVTHISISDSSNGMIISNEGQQDSGFAGQVSYAVVIGESENKGVPTAGFDRSLPAFWDTDRVQSGVSTWKGPTKFRHMWFDGFPSNDHYDIAAIAKKRFSRYFFSVLNSFTDTLFAFDDPEEGRIAISGTKDLPGWEDNKDGELMAGFTWNTDEGRKWVVKPDGLTADPADCKKRSDWRLAICTTKYGTLKTHGVFKGRDAIYVRDDVPSAQLVFDEEVATGPQVVLDGSRTYTVHFTPNFTGTVQIVAHGLEMGDTLRLGVCTPLGSTIEIKTNNPYNLNTITKFTEVFSLVELDAVNATHDGKKYFHDTTTGMVYYKFVNDEMRNEDESNTCNDNKCPNIKVTATGGDPTDTDCRSRLYTAAELSMALPVLTEYSDTIPANGQSTPPAGYGAGITMPFLERTAVNGGWGDWSEYTTCSRTCGHGKKYRTRQCNEPMPENGGASCTGNSVDVQGCLNIHCPIKGGWGTWGAWGRCVFHHLTETGACSGVSVRTKPCDNPTPRYGGEFCTGVRTEVKPCTDCNPQ